MFRLCKMGLLLFVLSAVSSFSFADNFSIYFDSDNGDYIGQGKIQHFSGKEKDKLSTRKNYEMNSDHGYRFILNSFSLGSNINLTFEPGTGVFKKGMYYPAKRYPFNDDYNGIDISGDGRGCNKILGGFYVHEFELSADKKSVKKAAIDFVQYCEEGGDGLFGSLRFNSKVPETCTDAGCDKVRARFGKLRPENKFSIYLDSDVGDFIGQGKKYHFTNKNKDKLTITRTYDTSKEFIVESFSTSLHFTFDPEGGTFKKGMYYPAKRHPFNDDYNGIDISGDGRGCNKILGGFYVHEFELSADKKSVKKAAIDFVQYCEEGISGLYGSLRMNSSIPESCTANGCDKVRKMFLKKDENASIAVDHTSLDEIKMKAEGLDKRIQDKYPLFYKECLSTEKYDLILENTSTYFNIYACDGKYIKVLRLVNKVLDKVLGPRNNGGGDILKNMNIETKTQMIAGIKKFIAKIDKVRSKLISSKKMTNDIDIALSALAYLFDMSAFVIDII